MDSIDLFHSICEEKYLKNACIILFLNKSDLFRQKIVNVPINSVPAFADFKGPVGDYQAGVDYFASKFVARMSPKRLVSNLTAPMYPLQLRVLIYFFFYFSSIFNSFTNM